MAERPGTVLRLRFTRALPIDQWERSTVERERLAFIQWLYDTGWEDYDSELEEEELAGIRLFYKHNANQSHISHISRRFGPLVGTGGLTWLEETK